MHIILSLIIGLPAFVLACVKLYESKTVQDQIQEHEKHGVHEDRYQVMY